MLLWGRTRMVRYAGSFDGFVAVFPTPHGRQTARSFSKSFQPTPGLIQNLILPLVYHHAASPPGVLWIAVRCPGFVAACVSHRVAARPRAQQSGANRRQQREHAEVEHMASPLVCDRWRHAAAAGGVSGSSNKRRRRCFSSVPLQPAVEPPSPFSSAPSTGRRLGGAASSASPPRARSSLPSRCAMRAAGARSSAFSPAAGMPAACAARCTVASPVQHDGEEEEEEWVQPSSTRLRRHHPYRRAGTGAGSSRATRGLLSRATTVAVTVAAVAVSASAPVGVSAVMSKEQCKDATFRGTVDDLMESPRADTATEAAAAGIDRTIVASQVCVCMDPCVGVSRRALPLSISGGVGFVLGVSCCGFVRTCHRLAAVCTSHVVRTTGRNRFFLHCDTATGPELVKELALSQRWDRLAPKSATAAAQ